MLDIEAYINDAYNIIYVSIKEDACNIITNDLSESCRLHHPKNTQNTEQGTAINSILPNTRSSSNTPQCYAFANYLLQYSKQLRKLS